MPRNKPLVRSTVKAKPLALSYIFHPQPNPIRASPTTGNPRTVSIQVIVAKRGFDPVSLQSVKLKFPIGDDSSDNLSPSLPQPRLDTPGAWNVDLSGANSILITAADPDGVLTFDQQALVFTLENVQVVTNPGIAHVAITEKTGDGKSAGEGQIEKLPWDFEIEAFYADPPMVGDPERPVRLFWTGSGGADVPLQLSSSEGWRPRDCINNSDCFHMADGAQGVDTPPMTRTTTFSLDIVRASADGPKVSKTVTLTVPLTAVSFLPSHRLDCSPTGRIVRLQWIAYNAQKCSVKVDDAVYDENAPVDTMSDATSYFIVLDGAAGTTPKIKLTAHGIAGTLADLPPMEGIPLKDPIALASPLDYQIGASADFAADGATAVIAQLAENLDAYASFVDVAGRALAGAAMKIPHPRHSLPLGRMAAPWGVAMHKGSAFIAAADHLIEVDATKREFRRIGNIGADCLAHAPKSNLILAIDSTAITPFDIKAGKVCERRPFVVGNAFFDPKKGKKGTWQLFDQETMKWLSLDKMAKKAKWLEVNRAALQFFFPGVMSIAVSHDETAILAGGLAYTVGFNLRTSLFGMATLRPNPERYAWQRIGCDLHDSKKPMLDLEGVPVRPGVGPHSVGFNATGKLAAITGDEGTEIIDPANRQVQRRVAGGKLSRFLGDRLLLIGQEAGVVAADAASGKTVAQLAIPAGSDIALWPGSYDHRNPAAIVAGYVAHFIPGKVVEYRSRDIFGAPITIREQVEPDVTRYEPRLYLL